MIWFLMGCSSTLPYNSLFDAPVSSTVVSKDDGLWQSNLGFVANHQRGTIVPLDIDNHTAFGDQHSAPFLRSRGVATGRLRQLDQIVAYTPQENAIALYAIDHYSQKLVLVPYIIDMNPEPQVVQPTTSEVLFIDQDSSGDAPTLVVDQLTTGSTTTETWTFTNMGDHWTVEGSRSGLQEDPAYSGNSYSSTEGQITVTITGTASIGDQFEFQTQTQIQEFDLGGQPLKMVEWHENQLLISVWHAAQNQSSLVLFDQQSNSIIDSWRSDENIQLGDLLKVDDFLVATDAYNPQLLKLEIEGDAISNAVLSIIPSISIAQDLEIIQTEEYDHLFVATAEDQRIDIYDLRKEEWKHINVHQDLRGGPRLYSPIVGMAATKAPIQLQSTSPWFANESDYVIVATLFNGSVIMVEGATGCLATTVDGASVDVDSSYYNNIEFVDTSPASNPEVYVSSNGDMLSTSNCGGVLQDEDWTVRYDGRTGDWEVEGSISGILENRAQLDERYISDDGGFSFLLLSGTAAPTDGDLFSFSTLANTLDLSVITNTAGGLEALQVPAPPTTFQEYAPLSNAGWVDGRPKQYALIPVTNNNIVMQLDLESWTVEYVWN